MRLSPRLKRLLALTVLLIVLFIAAFLWFRPLLNIGAGYAAKHACSCHYLQGRELEEIREYDLNFSVLGSVSLWKETEAIGASFYGLVSRRAVYRPGVGCTLINDERVPLVEVQGAGAGAGQDKRAVVGGPAALTNALEFGMAPVPGGGARGLVILQDGEIVAERYAPGFDQNTPLLGWSMTKTLTALLLGYSLKPYLAPAASPHAFTERGGLFSDIWTDSARQEITLADLLHMNSGLAWNEAYGSLSDATIMLHEQADMAEYASIVPAVAPHGTVWNYSSGTTNILMELIRRQRPDIPITYQLEELYGEVAPSLFIEPSQAGLPVGSSYGWATARDWANLGQFMLQDGVWNGDTLLPPGWVDYLLEPAEGSEGTYGGQTWLPGPDMPSLPPDAYMMRGFQDQRVFIIPSRRLVIARLGHGNDQVTDFDGLVKQVLACPAIK